MANQRKAKDEARNKAELARKLGVTPERVTQVSHGWPFAQSGPFDVEKVRSWWRANIQRPAPRVGAAGRKAGGEEGGGEELGLLARARVRHLLSQSERLQLQIEEQKRNSIPRKEAQAEVSGVFQSFRSALEALPGQLADALEADGCLAPGARDGVEARARGDVDRILKALAEGLKRAVAPRD